VLSDDDPLVSGTNRLPDMLKRILITLAALVGYLFLRAIPIPGINIDSSSSSLLLSHHVVPEESFFRFAQNGIPQRFSVLAVGLMPYISAHVLVMLLVLAGPYLKKKKGWSSLKLSRFVVYVTSALTFIQATLSAFSIWNTPLVFKVLLPAGVFTVVATLSLAAGTCSVIWLGRMISRHGIGHGISILIIFPIAAELLEGIARAWRTLPHNKEIFLFFALFLVISIGFIQHALNYKKEIPVEASDRRGESASMELFPSSVGVIPVRFATDLIRFPVTIAAMGLYSWDSPLGQLIAILKSNAGAYGIVFGLLVAFLTFFFFAVVLNPLNLSNKMKEVGLVIQHVKPGMATAQYLDVMLIRLFIGWVSFLIGMSFLWEIIPHWLGVEGFQLRGVEFVLVVGVFCSVWRSLINESYSKEVYRHHDPAEIAIVKARLEIEGVKCVIAESEGFGRFYPIFVGQLGLKRILVEENTVPKARSVISQLDRLM